MELFAGRTDVTDQNVILRPNGSIQRGRSEMLVVIEAFAGRPPLQLVLGAFRETKHLLFLPFMGQSSWGHAFLLSVPSGQAYFLKFKGLFRALFLTIGALINAEKAIQQVGGILE